MGLVEFIGLVAADCAVRPEAIEKAVGRRFTTLRELARALEAAGIAPRQMEDREVSPADHPAREVPARLVAVQIVLPTQLQPAEALDGLLDRPAGWLQQHTGIGTRRAWSGEDAVAAACQAALSCLEAAGRPTLAALLVTGEAPPRLLGLAAALHTCLGLPANIPALEVGGACTALVHCLWLARHLVRPDAAVLIVAVEAPSLWLEVRPGPEGEAAALFGDGAGACLLAAAPGRTGWSVRDVIVGCDGAAASLLTIRRDSGRPVVQMNSPALALRAVEQLAEVTQQMCAAHGLTPADLDGVFIHAGNGRMPALVAQRLGVPADRIHATTPWTGNLGSVSLLAALAHCPPQGTPVCAAVGAGLCWGAVLLGSPIQRTS
jgi:3-oxoacyl-[acyl-carrier-protein] synthase-3